LIVEILLRRAVVKEVVATRRNLEEEALSASNHTELM